MTSGISPRFSSMTMRMPSRSDSSRRSRDAFDDLLVRELGDLLDQPGLVDLVGDLGDDDRLLVALLVLLDRRLARASMIEPRPVVKAW